MRVNTYYKIKLRGKWVGNCLENGFDPFMIAVNAVIEGGLGVGYYFAEFDRTDSNRVVRDDPYRKEPVSIEHSQLRDFWKENQSRIGETEECCLYFCTVAYIKDELVQSFFKYSNNEDTIIWDWEMEDLLGQDEYEVQYYDQAQEIEYDELNEDTNEMMLYDYSPGDDEGYKRYYGYRCKDIIRLRNEVPIGDNILIPKNQVNARKPLYDLFFDHKGTETGKLFVSFDYDSFNAFMMMINHGPERVVNTIRDRLALIDHEYRAVFSEDETDINFRLFDDDSPEQSSAVTVSKKRFTAEEIGKMTDTQVRIIYEELGSDRRLERMRLKARGDENADIVHPYYSHFDSVSGFKVSPKYYGSRVLESVWAEKQFELCEDAYYKLRYLIGAEGFKQLVKEMTDSGDFIKAHYYGLRIPDIIIDRCYLISIDDGWGLSTYLELYDCFMKEWFHDLLPDCFEFNVHKIVECRAVEIEKPLGRYIVLSNENAEPVDMDMAGCTVCVDITGIGDKNSPVFKRFIKEIKQLMKKNIVFLRVPYMEDKALNDTVDCFGGEIYIRTVSVPHFTVDELMWFAKKEMQLKVTDDAWEIFRKRLETEIKKPCFHGLETVRNLIKQMCYCKAAIPPDIIGFYPPNERDNWTEDSENGVSDLELCYGIGPDPLGDMAFMRDFMPEYMRSIDYYERKKSEWKENGYERHDFHVRYTEISPEDLKEFCTEET